MDFHLQWGGVGQDMIDLQIGHLGIQVKNSSAQENQNGGELGDFHVVM